VVATIVTRLTRIRLVRFAIVGLLCLGLQYLIVELLHIELGYNAFLSDAIGFAVSAQLNFLLSNQFSWGDAPRVRRRALWCRWRNFLGVAGLATIINASVFAVAHVAMGTLAAIVCASVVSTTWTFLLNHYFVFKPARGRFGSELSSEQATK
jgi:putative flippase GtrA